MLLALNTLDGTGVFFSLPFDLIVFLEKDHLEH
jgi:hypothetical protein